MKSRSRSKNAIQARRLIRAAKSDGSYNEDTVEFWLCCWFGYFDAAQKMWKANEKRHSTAGFKTRTAAVLDTIRRAPVKAKN